MIPSHRTGGTYRLGRPLTQERQAVRTAPGFSVCRLPSGEVAEMALTDRPAVIRRGDFLFTNIFGKTFL